MLTAINIDTGAVFMDKTHDAKRVATTVSLVGMIGNIALTLFKLFAGIVANSGAMISDAVHSASDVFSGIIVIYLL